MLKKSRPSQHCRLKEEAKYSDVSKADLIINLQE